jgi:hypothetical protein
MDPTTSPTGNPIAGSDNPFYPSASAASAKVEDAAQPVHRTSDKIADKATAQVDRLSGTAHRAVSSVSDAASSAAEWASAVPDQAKQIPVRLTEAVSASIRARPIATAVGAVVIGYLLGRLGRS